MAAKRSGVRIAVLGDDNTGKSSFLFRLETDRFRGTSRSRSYEFMAEVIVDSKSVTTSAWLIGESTSPTVSNCLLDKYRYIR